MLVIGMLINSKLILNSVSEQILSITDLYFYILYIFLSIYITLALKFTVLYFQIRFECC